MERKRAAGARALALTKMRERWKGAPMHIRAMIGDYVTPLFDALEAMAAELETIHAAPAVEMPIEVTRCEHCHAGAGCKCRAGGGDHGA